MLRSVVRGHVYVGAVDEGRHLLQHQTQLYLVDTTACCEELFYQEALRRFLHFTVRRRNVEAGLTGVSVGAFWSG